MGWEAGTNGDVFTAISMLSGNMINRYGFYLPTDPYMFVFWRHIVTVAVVTAALLLGRRLKGKDIFTGAADRGQTGDCKVTLSKMKSGYRKDENLSCAETGFMTGGLRPDPPRTQVPVSSLIEHAVLHSENIFIIYNDRDGERTERLVKPGCIFYENGNEYMRGYCFLRRQDRTFRVSRILDLEFERAL